MSCDIKHIGTVTGLHKNAVTVHVQQRAACAGCASKDACTLSSEKKDMMLTVKHPQPTLFSVGETVKLVSTQKKLYTAVWWAYVLPLIGLMAVVIISLHCFNNEVVAAGMGLVFCAVYALLLLLLPQKITQHLQIEIEKII